MYKNVTCRKKLISTVLNSDKLCVENSRLKLVRKNQIDRWNSEFE